jgi:tetratricopeptide (TPR) repeat protein
MPIRRISAADAFATLKANPESDWPRRDDPGNRFAHFADPVFKPRFVLEPGQRIFTIGSCFARGVEKALARRGFDIPTLIVQSGKDDWGKDPSSILNNYVPPAIAPQIRWAFGMEKFEIDRHTAAFGPARLLDLFLPLVVRPAPPEAVLARREAINDIYRKLAESNVVVITLGLIEAWFDNRSGLYINCTPTRQLIKADPARFELHVLGYDEVTAALSELVDLLGEVCPRGHRVILTVSPVPLTATFTDADVAVANSYSKSVLRAAVEPFVAAREHIEYFPSFESVLLTERSAAFVDDQIHVTPAMVRFNVDRMIRRYVKGEAAESAAEVIAQAREDTKSGLFNVGLKRLQQAWTANPEDPALTLALGRALLKADSGPQAEQLFLDHLDSHENVTARTLLARYYNATGRHEEAALQAEKAAEQGKMRLEAAIERAAAYYHLGRFDEGLAVIEHTRAPLERKPLVTFWKARFNERLGRPAEAEECYRFCIRTGENPQFLSGFASFLAAQDRWPEVPEWVDRTLALAPEDKTALGLRVELRRRGLPTASSNGAGRLDGLSRWSAGLVRLASRLRRPAVATRDDG